MNFKTKITKLSPQKGDIIVIRCNGLLRDKIGQINKIKEYIQEKHKDTQFIVMGLDAEIELIPEKKMNQLGWYKK